MLAAEAQPVSLMEGQWWVTLGYNAVYDCYLCQVSLHWVVLTAMVIIIIAASANNKHTRARI